MISTDSFAVLFARNRLLVATAIVALTALAARGHFQRKPGRPISRQREEQPDDRLLREVSDEFDVRQNDCFLVIDADDLFTPDAVAAVRAVVDGVEELDYVDRVFSLDNLPVLNAFGVPEPILPRIGAADESFLEARAKALKHPLVAGQLVSPDGKTLLLPVAIEWLNVTSDRDLSTGLLEVSRQVAAEYPDAGLRIRLTGSVPVFLAQDEAFARNDRKFRVISYVLTGIMAVLLFRGIAAVLIVAAAPVLAIFWSYGLIRLFDIPVNDLTNAILPVLITMVGMTDGIHLMVYIRRLRADGSTPLDSACEAIRHVGLACLLTSLTTAIGFASLLLAESKFIHDFGMACALGVVVSFAAVITIIPLACSTRLAKNVHRGQEHDIVGRGLKHFGGLIDAVLLRARLITAGAIGATVLLAAIAFQLRPDAKRGNILPAASEAAQALEHCDWAFGGIDFARIVIEWPETITPDSPEILKAVYRVENVVAAEPLLRHPLSIRNIVESFPGDEMSPEARMTFLELMPSGLRRLLFNPAERRTLVTVRVQDIGLAAYNPVFARVEQQLQQLEREHPGFQFDLTGDVVVGGRDLTQIVYDLAASLGTATLVILVVIALFYRSLRIGLITLVPNLFPLVLTAAALYLFGGSLTIVTVCAFTICIGIAVDDTIHFLTRFQYESSRGKEIPAALHDTFMGVGNALVMTTLILVTGFGTVLTSELPAHRTFSAMACSTIAAALLGDLVFFPAMLACFVRRGNGDEKREKPRKDERVVEAK